ncbi:VCBS repeat-containing protein [Ulvibacterium marinum]|uniref:VCBS repeat-containing protein n=1 Tax=Ulvibacterium marinum TaxID=2419782 RepID=UPI0024959D69|nr:VCBS repeat-containing protein [Ulvibacterium marinum]
MKNLISSNSIFSGIVLLILLTSCGQKDSSPTLFTKIEPVQSGLHFNNQLVENDSINIIDNEFVYNGAGVALGDLNDDGLDDIFFAGNQVDNKLFLNRGNLKFEDISQKAKIGKPDSLFWSSGVSIIDVNADGKKDIYVCNTFYKDSLRRKNLLYIHQGTNDKGIPIFKEMGEAYGIADYTYSSHAQFFDYDNDGDLDLFIGVNRIEGIDPSEFRPLDDDGTSLSRDKLYENQWNDSLQHPYFVDISEKAGIRYHGYSHSTLINDFNEDGWLDIYVANDFLSNDLMYINNQDGTFTNRAGEVFQHFSLSSMGSDLADIDNDGRMDIYTTEMQPYYNKRKKLFQGPSSYQKEIFTKKYGYENQYARNTMQLNLGINPETGNPIFGDMGMYAGVQETDWSWAPLFADLDNDGWQDLFITNGFPKDVTDRDFGDFRITASRLVSKETLIAAIPEIKIPNFVFKNQGDLGFADVTQEWGLNFGTFSSGAAYGDLDNDGDLDLVINNINEPVLLLRNNLDQTASNNNYLRMQLIGKKENTAAIGAVVELYTKGIIQKKSVLSGRGYLSQPENILHFGLGNATVADSIIIYWPGEGKQKLTNVKVDTLLQITYNTSALRVDNTKDKIGKIDFQEVSKNYNLDHLSEDHDFIDFNFQRTLPHKFSQYGPSLAIGDVDNNGLEDMFVAASRKFKQKWFLQQKDGTFKQSEVTYKKDAELQEEDAGTLLFDADNDGDLDLYIARGCGQYPAGHEFYKDVLLLNDGKGNFTESEESLPNITANSSAIKAADYDRDGDLDLFVGSRVLPFSYPMADRSYILRNESTKGNPKFVDATKDVFPETNPGLISDALWTDFNGDFWPDLILAGEWMPLRFFKNENGKLVEVTKDTGIDNYMGWWNSLAAADLDNDGDMDYIAGNSGKNIYFKGSAEEPVRVYAKDLDDNGTIDPLISYYLRDSIGTRKEYLYHPWQDVTKQFVGIRKKFNSFGAFGESTLPEMFSDGLLDDATVLSFNYMQTSWVENLGNGKFEIHPLPTAAQLAPIYGIVPKHLDNDNFVDLLLVGNDYGMEVQQGPADALVGLTLRNTGKGNFMPIALEKSHFLVPGDGKSLVTLNIDNEKMLVVASQNNDSLRVFEPKQRLFKSLLQLEPNEVRSQIKFKDGSHSVQEFYWGNTFQSQSSRTLTINANAAEIRIFDALGKETRKIAF